MIKTCTESSQRPNTACEIFEVFTNSQRSSDIFLTGATFEEFADFSRYLQFSLKFASFPGRYNLLWHKTDFNLQHLPFSEPNILWSLHDMCYLTLSYILVVWKQKGFLTQPCTEQQG